MNADPKLFCELPKPVVIKLLPIISYQNSRYSKPANQRLPYESGRVRSVILASGFAFAHLVKYSMATTLYLLCPFSQWECLTKSILH